MKIFRFLLPFVLCVAFAGSMIFCAYLFADNLFDCDGSFDADIRTVGTKTAPEPYPWYAVECGEAVEIATQEHTINMLICIMTGWDEFVEDFGSCYFSEELHMYFAKDVVLSGGEVIDIAYHLRNGEYTLSYLRLHSPCDSSETVLQSEQLRLLEILKSKRYESSEIYEKENQNPFAALFEYVSRSSDFAHAGFAPFSKKALYVLYNLAYVDSSVSVQSYIYGGLVRLDCKSDETSFSVEYDAAVDAIISFAIKES